MVLNLTAYVRNIFYFYKQTTRQNSNIKNFFGEKKKEFWPILYILKIAKWGKIDNYDVIVTS